MSEAGWDVASAREELAADIEGHMERLIASKVCPLCPVPYDDDFDTRNGVPGVRIFIC